MKTDIYDAIFYINQATSLEELTRIFERILVPYGFDLFAVQYTTPELTKAKAQPHFLCNFPTEWVEHYYSARYYELDPVILKGKEKRKPYFWNRMWDGIEMSPEQRQFFNEADEYGVASGIGMPVLLVNNEPGIVSFVSSVCDQKEIEQIMGQDHVDIALLATSFHHAVSKFFEGKPHPDAPHLTSRERECLTWAAAGKTDAEIGLILNISHRTVNMHMANSYQKLNCSSREQAVVKALLMKVISV
jgi:DNA-binding CsgD family transcriptional regulator